MQVDREEYLAIRARWLEAQKEIRLLRLDIERMEAGKDPMRSPLAFLEAGLPPGGPRRRPTSSTCRRLSLCSPSGSKRSGRGSTRSVPRVES